jgi:hypothetical protein
MSVSREEVMELYQMSLSALRRAEAALLLHITLKGTHPKIDKALASTRTTIKELEGAIRRG